MSSYCFKTCLCLLLFLLQGSVAIICVGLKVSYRTKLVRLVRWDGFWQLWFRSCFFPHVPSADHSSNLGAVSWDGLRLPKAEACQRNWVYRGNHSWDECRYVCAVIHQPLITQSWIIIPADNLHFPVSSAGERAWLMTAILLTQLFWEHGVGLKILGF